MIINSESDNTSNQDKLNQQYRQGYNSKLNQKHQNTVKRLFKKTLRKFLKKNKQGKEDRTNTHRILYWFTQV